MPNQRKQILPLLFLFIGVNTFLLTMPSFFEKYGIDRNVLLIANTLFFVTNLITFLLQKKALKNANPNVYVRSVMGGTLIKMLVVLIAFVTYVLSNGKAVNRPAIYIGIALYFIYLAIEVIIATKLNKKKNA